MGEGGSTLALQVPARPLRVSQLKLVLFYEKETGCVSAYDLLSEPGLTCAYEKPSDSWEDGKREE